MTQDHSIGDISPAGYPPAWLLHSLTVSFPSELDTVGEILIIPLLSLKHISHTTVATLVIPLMLTATYGESVNSIPFLDIFPPIGPMLKGTRYIVRPFMQPGNRWEISLSKSSGDIQ